MAARLWMEVEGDGEPVVMIHGLGGSVHAACIRICAP